jgi:hypothetical protein
MNANDEMRAQLMSNAVTHKIDALIREIRKEITTSKRSLLGRGLEVMPPLFSVEDNDWGIADETRAKHALRIVEVAEVLGILPPDPDGEGPNLFALMLD